MTATAEPGRPDDWADTGPIPNTSDTAVWRDRGVIIANLTTENERLRAEVERLLWEMADDLRTLLSEQPTPGVEPEAKRWRLRVAALNRSTGLASVGRAG